MAKRKRKLTPKQFGGMQASGDLWKKGKDGKRRKSAGTESKKSSKKRTKKKTTKKKSSKKRSKKCRC